jgi:hypothetical protein
MIGWGLATCAIGALVGIGLVGVLAPRHAAAQYGIVLDDARALGLIRAMAARDLVVGALLGLIAFAATRDALGSAMCLTALIAVVDLVVVAADRGATSRAPMERATALHGSGAVGLLVAGGALLAGC